MAAQEQESGMNRRSFIVSGLAAGAALVLADRLLYGTAFAEGEDYKLPDLGFADNALEPFIDAETMTIHRTKHHAAYIKNLNDVIKENADLGKLKLDEMLADGAAKVPEAVRQKVINNGGGHYNHTLFWSILGQKDKVKATPEGKLDEAIKSTFGDLKTCTDKLVTEGMNRFGSGWSWLVKTKDGKLAIYSTANQDCPLMKGDMPLLGLDVWEHAYYLKYKNLRKDYLTAIWNVINWEEVGKRFA